MYPADFGLPRVSLNFYDIIVVWPWNKKYVLQDTAQVSVGGNLQLVSSRLAFSHQENLQFAQAFPAKQVNVLTRPLTNFKKSSKQLLTASWHCFNIQTFTRIA